MKIRYIFLLLLAVNYFSDKSEAESIMDFDDWTKISQDEKTILVMISELKSSEEKIALPDGRKGVIRKFFKTSGIYDAATLKLLLPLNLFINEGQFRSSANFDSIVLEHVFIKNEELLILIKNNKITGTHKYSDLQHSINAGYFFTYFWINDNKLQENTYIHKTYTLGIFGFNTGWHKTYNFDMETGKIVSQKTDMGIIPLAGGSIIIVMLSLLIYIFSQIKKKVQTN